MARRTFDFSPSDIELLEDMLEELFLLDDEYCRKDNEIEKLLGRMPVDYDRPSNYLLLIHCLSREIRRVKDDLKSIDSVLFRLREQKDAFND